MTPLRSIPRTAAAHFRLQFYGAALRLRERAGESQFAFLADYCAEPDAGGLGEPAAWEAALADWEAGAPLPLTRLAAAGGLSRDAVNALFVIGLPDEDARFGAIFETFTGHPRPTAGLLHAWWPGTRAGLRRLAALGLAEASEPDVPRADSPLRVPPVVWDAIRGDAPDGASPSWLRHRTADELTPLADLILPPPIHAAVRRAPAVLAGGQADAIVVRGPAAGGRRTVVGAIARATGRGLLELSGLSDRDPRWRAAGALATLLDAVPAVILDPAPGETAHVPSVDGGRGPLGIVLGRRGGVAGPGVERAVTLALDVPAAAERERHWAAALGPHADAPGLATRYRMTGGNIRRAATLARAEAALAGRPEPGADDVAMGARTLHGRLLDTLATRVATDDDWDRVAVRPETMRELRLLEARCRHRERVGATVGPSAAADATAGVRALLTGASGTGKTLAARTLAGVLGIDLYRIDLATVVNKYLGETEKNLDRLFSHAEEADAALLLDEGDALMTRRTDVQTSNDRYANLETNFLLQRLESFEGILLVTSNAGDRIDDAFRRRMDVVVDFGLPDELERWAIWNLHLPPEHAVADELLGELATRCALTGGQMRNAVLHASLLALEGPGVILTEHLEAAVRREYAKTGQVCPLVAEVRVG
jgi:hypothetical protein